MADTVVRRQGFVCKHNGRNTHPQRLRQRYAALREGHQGDVDLHPGAYGLDARRLAGGGLVVTGAERDTVRRRLKRRAPWPRRRHIGYCAATEMWARSNPARFGACGATRSKKGRPSSEKCLL